MAWIIIVLECSGIHFYEITKNIQCYKCAEEVVDDDLGRQPEIILLHVNGI